MGKVTRVPETNDQPHYTTYSLFPSCSPAAAARLFLGCLSVPGPQQQPMLLYSLLPLTQAAGERESSRRGWNHFL